LAGGGGIHLMSFLKGIKTGFILWTDL